jgi:hypothetical protein
MDNLLSSSDTLKTVSDNSKDVSTKKTVSNPDVTVKSTKKYDVKLKEALNQDQFEVKETPEKKPFVNYLVSALIFILCVGFIVFFLHISNDKTDTRSKVFIENNTESIQQGPEMHQISQTAQQTQVKEEMPLYFDPPKPTPIQIIDFSTPQMEITPQPIDTEKPDSGFDLYEDNLMINHYNPHKNK